MDVHDEYFSDFLLHYESVNLHDLRAGFPAEVQQAPFVLIFYIVRIVSTNAFGLDLIAEDHTENALLALRGYSAFDFYETHLRSPHHRDPITDPYALDSSRFQTYLFEIDSCSPITIDGKDAFVVPKICMKSRVVDQFFDYQMSEYDAECYRRARAVAVPYGNGYGSSGGRHSVFDSMVLGLGVGTNKRIYAPYMPHDVVPDVLGD